MRIRTLEFTNTFSPQELAEALVDAGFARSDSLGPIASGMVDADETDDEISLRCVIDEEEALDFLGEDAILAAAGDLMRSREDAVEEALRYVRGGDYALARAMFARVFEDGAAMRAVDQALS